MLINNNRVIGNKLYEIRKKAGLTQAEVAEKAELSDRTYADIERGSVTMRVDSLLKICAALSITPDDVLTEKAETPITGQDIADAIAACSEREKETALRILSAYVKSLK